MRDPDQPVEIGRLKRRADFLYAAKGRRFHVDAMSIHANVAAAPSAGPAVRVGFTLTRKVGSAAVRNRIRRRLKEAVRLSSDLPVVPGHDYVILGRVAGLHAPFAALREQLVRAVGGVHSPAKPSRGRERSRPSPNAGSSSTTSSKGIAS